jgi:hypothetical protein
MNPEDDLLRELGSMARERDEEERRRLGEEWDRLAAGDLSPEEEAALAERAARSPEGAAALAAFRPLGSDFEARVVGTVLAQRRREAAEAHALPPPLPAPAASSAPLPAPLAARRRFVRPRRTAGWAAILAAAGLAGVLLTRPAPPLPAYFAELSAGVRTERGAAGAPSPVYAPGARFELVLHPTTAVAGAVGMQCRIAPAAGGASRDWPPCAHAERAAGGAFRVAGTVGREIPYEPGEWTLWVIVARTRLLGRWVAPAGPADSELRRLRPGAALAGRGWIALRLADTIRFAGR